ncbi:ExbD/TolR family protein [Aliikangiella coralliicola]|uniref:Biopolymer transporter ExbD n=1 Tax=Aliikangiella coralliicola TaxID=2592383 RepID=A0A545U8P0_9GAMM|nr:biopolymer transporter ExbD [Aliikangiella coralliicola]TQV85835.1 biopolymer transporter ExbD [Aliikangiella coralliicola]
MFFRTKKQDVAINLTPLIDVVFLLLIFFMVSTSFTRETQIKLELPKANVEKLKTEPEVIEISIDKEGRIFINGKSLVNAQVDTLVKAITPLIGDDTNTPVIISADANTAYQSVVTALDAASQLGITNLKMATQKNKE